MIVEFGRVSKKTKGWYAFILFEGGLFPIPNWT